MMEDDLWQFCLQAATIPKKEKVHFMISEGNKLSLSLSGKVPPRCEPEVNW